MSATHPRIWVLLGPRTGDNNQALALAERLGVPFETRTLQYNLLRALGGRILGKSLLSLYRDSRDRIKPPWPDLIIAIGRRSVPVARWIQHASGGRTKLVRIGNPRIDPRFFDLVVTTRQYPVPRGDNVVLLPLAMSRYSSPPKAEQDEIRLLGDLPRPHLLMAIGGATKYWTLPSDQVAEITCQLANRAKDRGGSLIAVASQRTHPQVLQAVRTACHSRAECILVDAGRPRFPVLLADADEVFVTGDSISMMSEAIIAGKPVGLVPLQLTRRGKRKLGAAASPESRRRDLRRFWTHLQQQGLIGTVGQPTMSPAADPAVTAAAAVRRLLGDSG